MSPKLGVARNSVDKDLVSWQKSNFSVIVQSESESSSKREVLNGGLCMLGGALLHMTFGTVYCWGNFISYMPSNLKFLDGLEYVGKQPDAVFVLPLAIVAQCMTMPLGPVLVQLFGANKVAVLGGLLLALGVYLSSYAKTLKVFMALYSILFGASIGISYTSPMIAGWKWLPKSKGLVSGVVLMGYGIGGFIFNLIGTKIANPNSLNVVGGKFPEEVYANFPTMLRKLAVMYAAMSIVGAAMITEPSKPKVEQSLTEKKTQSLPVAASGLDIGEAIRTPQFWMLWSMIVCSASAGLNVASVYKRFALAAPSLSGDQFQALVGGLGAICNGGGRVAWGTLSDKIGFKRSFISLALLQSFIQFAYPFSSTSRV